MSRRSPQRGVTYLLLLLAVAITSGALAAGAVVWSQIQRREREKQLLWVGDQIRKAIVAYSQAGSDDVSPYPVALQDLLLDPRSLARRRFLRQIYIDPMTGSADWGLIRNPQGRIVGIHSRSDGKPIKTGRFAPEYVDFAQAVSYADWRFTAVAQAPVEQRPRVRGATASPGVTAGPAGSSGHGATVVPAAPRGPPMPAPPAGRQAEPASATASPTPPPAEPEPDDGGAEGSVNKTDDGARSSD